MFATFAFICLALGGVFSNHSPVFVSATQQLYNGGTTSGDLSIYVQLSDTLISVQGVTITAGGSLLIYMPLAGTGGILQPGLRVEIEGNTIDGDLMFGYTALSGEQRVGVFSGGSTIHIADNTLSLGKLAPVGYVVNSGSRLQSIQLRGGSNMTVVRNSANDMHLAHLTETAPAAQDLEFHLDDSSWLIVEDNSFADDWNAIEAGGRYSTVTVRVRRSSQIRLARNTVVGTWYSFVESFDRDCTAQLIIEDHSHVTLTENTIRAVVFLDASRGLAHISLNHSSTFSFVNHVLNHGSGPNFELGLCQYNNGIAGIARLTASHSSEFIIANNYGRFVDLFVGLFDDSNTPEAYLSDESYFVFRNNDFEDLWFAQAGGDAKVSLETRGASSFRFLDNNFRDEMKMFWMDDGTSSVSFTSLNTAASGVPGLLFSGNTIVDGAWFFYDISATLKLRGFFQILSNTFESTKPVIFGDDSPTIIGGDDAFPTKITLQSNIFKNQFTFSPFILGASVANSVPIEVLGNEFRYGTSAPIFGIGTLPSILFNENVFAHATGVTVSGSTIVDPSGRQVLCNTLASDGRFVTSYSGIAGGLGFTIYHNCRTWTISESAGATASVERSMSLAVPERTLTVANTGAISATVMIAPPPPQLPAPSSFAGSNNEPSSAAVSGPVTGASTSSAVAVLDSPFSFSSSSARQGPVLSFPTGSQGETPAEVTSSGSTESRQEVLSSEFGENPGVGAAPNSLAKASGLSGAETAGISILVIVIIVCIASGIGFGVWRYRMNQKAKTEGRDVQSDAEMKVVSVTEVGKTAPSKTNAAAKYSPQETSLFDT